MGHQQSTFDKLPREIVLQLNAWLEDPAITQKDALAMLNDLLETSGVELKASRSALNRHAKKLEKVGRRMRESREFAEQLLSHVGPNKQTQVGQLITQILHGVSFEMSMHLQDGQLDEETAPVMVGMLKDLSLATMRLEKAANLNVEREKEIRQQALEDAAETIADTAIQRGLTKEDAQFWREQVLGIK